MRLLPLVFLLTAAACKNEQEIVPRSNDSVAVTTGDFDRVSEPLDRMLVEHSEYEGLISTATWDPHYDPEANTLKVELLFTTPDELKLHDSIFVASGTRGLGMQQYNGLLPDDAIVSNPIVAANLRDYVNSQGSIVATDWAYDMVEQTYPDQIEFWGEDDLFDDAQHGKDGDVVARVEDDNLAADLQSETLDIKFDFSNWAVIEDVGPDVTVWLSGDVQVQNGAEGYETLTGVPLLVSFEPEGPEKGIVVYSCFHIDAQTDFAIDQILRRVVGEFKEGSLEPSPID